MYNQFTTTTSRNQHQAKEIPHHLNQPNEKVLIPALRPNLPAFFAHSLFPPTITTQTRQLFNRRSRDTTYSTSNLTANENPHPFTKPPSTDLPTLVLKPLVLTDRQSYIQAPAPAIRHNFRTATHSQTLLLIQPPTTNLFSQKP